MFFAAVVIDSLSVSVTVIPWLHAASLQSAKKGRLSWHSFSSLFNVSSLWEVPHKQHRPNSEPGIYVWTRLV
jgi:hypothetical protein